MNKKISLIPSLCAISLSFIGAGCTNSSAPKVTSLKTGLLNICLGQNYTFTYVAHEGGNVTLVDHDLVFLSNSIGTISSKETVDTIYYKDKSGKIYSIGYNGEDFVGSEYYTQSKNLWDDSLTYSLYKDGYDYLNSLNDDITTIKITDKSYKIAFLETFGYSSDNLLNLESLVASYVPYKAGYGIQFDMTYKSALFTYIAHDFGTSTNKVLDNYIKSGKGAYKMSEEFTRIRDHIKENNYTRAVYQFDGENTGYIGYEVFNPQYFYTFYGDSLTSCSGAIAYDDRYTKHDKGTYYFAMTIDNGEATYQETPYVVYEKPDVVEMYHYPSYLSLLSHMEYFTAWNKNYIYNTEYVPGENAWILTDSQLLNDFVSNFSLDQNFSGSTPYCLGMEFVESEDSSRDIVVFIYKFIYDGEFYVMPIPFSLFGISNNTVLEYVLEQYK